MGAKDKIEDRFKGAIVGAAVGDALGMPTEYISRQELNELYEGKVITFRDPSPSHPCSHLKAGQYTDDTQQIIILAESLIDRQTFDIHDFAGGMGEWAHKCRTVPGFSRFAGGTSVSASLELYQGADPYTTGKSWPTCGSAMRIPPLGLFYRNDVAKLKEAASLASSITHNHPAAIDSAILISHLVAHLSAGNSIETAVRETGKLLNSDLIEGINYVVSNQEKSPKEVAKHIGTSESCYETVPMALHCFLHSPRDFEQTVVEAANLVFGDTDSIACIAGALSGAYNGFSSIPPKFTITLEDREKLLNIAEQLFQASKGVNCVA